MHKWSQTTSTNKHIVINFHFKHIGLEQNDCNITNDTLNAFILDISTAVHFKESNYQDVGINWDNNLASIGRQNITWSSVDPIHWRMTHIGMNQGSMS